MVAVAEKENTKPENVSTPLVALSSYSVNKGSDEVVEDLTLRPSKEDRLALCEALYKCTGSFKRIVSPLLPYPLVINRLHRDFVEAQEMSGGSAKEALMTFAMKMEEPGTKAFLSDAQAQIRAEPKVYAQNMVDDEWISDFQSQVDYVPGLSKGKRLLDSEDAKQFATFADEMKSAGNKCFASQDYEMALTRYTQGVELLQQVECKDEQPQRHLLELYTALLTNQAIAGLKTSAWRTSLTACTACLSINPRNLKARARRAEAYTCLGDIEAAALDLEVILRLQATELLEDHDPDTAQELLAAAQKDARKLSQRLERMTREESAAAKRMMAGADFTADRDKEKPPAPDIPQPPSILSSSTSRSRATDPLSAARPVSRLSTKPGSEKLIDEVVALEIQQSLMYIYSQPVVQGELIMLRKAADYESGRFVQRLRPYLARLLAEPILDRYNFGKGEEGYRRMERALGQHVTSSADVCENAKSLLAVLMGDLLEE
ncbi:hypothetical protein NSK_006531 [Nannochloropsis salina CCMP1776]|jgi:hypothetical protein|uniref:Uncharacterized protein n=1 Tax=Nannochloropsis salina CCMP1776 TaxID=1027361 RepID=A0A4D9CSL3_9STRA|nr:hypothetical protein NSK_006531 [Nannochloropsis salina CCMP1776]|eukprot:TFJ82202.1 hypothetical protein NSK_006531 [Nannochloropsis salina CCMP1776]